MTKILRGIRWKIYQRTPQFMLQHPYEWWVSVAAILSGAGGLFGYGNAVDRFGEPLGLIWSGAMLMAGVALFIGLTFKKFELQRLGHGLFGMVGLSFALLLIVNAPNASVLTISMYLVLSSVAFFRRFELTTVKRLAEERVRNRGE